MKRLFLIALFFSLAFLLKSVVSANAYAAVTIKVTLDNRDGAVNTAAVVNIYKSGDATLMASYYSPVARYTTPGTGQAIVQYTSSTDSGTNTPYTISWSNPYCGGGGTGTAVLNSTSGFYEITRSVRCTTINSIVNMSTISCTTTTGSVSWNVSNNNGGYPNISTFRVYKALSGSSFGTTYDSEPFVGTSNQSTFTAGYTKALTDLSTGVWVVRVVAVPNNPDQDNFTVNDVNLACGTAVIPPTAPLTVFSSCGASTSTVTFTWNAANPGTFTYGVQVLDQATNPTNPGPTDWGVSAIAQSAGITLATTSLASNHTYWANVVATETGGSKYYSVASSFTVPTSCQTASGISTAPSNLTAVQTCPSGVPTIAFIWNSVPNQSGSLTLDVSTDVFTSDTTSSPYNMAGHAYLTAPENGTGYTWDSSHAISGNANPQTTGFNGVPKAGATYYWRLKEITIAGTSKWVYPNGGAGTFSWSGIPVTISACTSQPYHDVKVEVVKDSFKVAGAVTSIVIDNPGSYPSTAPTITFTGGGGSGAAATANISDGVISSIIIDNPGSGYASPPGIGFSGGGAAAHSTIGDVPVSSVLAPSFSAGQTVTFRARVTNLNVNSGTALPAGNKLYFYYIGGGNVPNCINTLSNNAQISAPTDGASPAQQQEYTTQTILGSDNGQDYLDIRYNVGSTPGSKTAHLYAIPNCAFLTGDTATDPNWSNNDASFGYTVGVNKFLQTTGGDLGASWNRQPFGRSVSVGRVSDENRCSPVCPPALYQSSYGIIANVLSSNVRVPSAGFTLSGYGQNGLVPDGGVYAYFANKFKAKSLLIDGCTIADNTTYSGYYYCNHSVTISSLTTIKNNGGAPAVFFIDGDLIINNDLKLSVAADAAVYIVSGNITVSSTTPVRNLHGIFIAKGTFNDCTALCSVAATDALRIQGALYVDGIGGRLNLSRYFSTVTDNNSNPSDIINFEPKYLILLKDLLASSDVGWKEVSP